MYLAGVLDLYTIQLELAHQPPCGFARDLSSGDVAAQVIRKLESDETALHRSAAEKIIEIMPEMCAVYPTAKP
jgi:hypothetical protein